MIITIIIYLFIERVTKEKIKIVVDDSDNGHDNRCLYSNYFDSVVNRVVTMS